MTYKDLARWLKHAAPKKDGLLSIARSLEKRGGSGRWEGGVCSREDSLTVSLRYWGGPASHAAWLKAARRVFSVACPDAKAPGQGLPWLTLHWDFKTNGWTHLRFCFARAGGVVFDQQSPQAAPLRYRVARFSLKEFSGTVLDEPFRNFSRLCSIASVVTEARKPASRRLGQTQRWALRLRRGVPWPAFLRCDLSNGFSSRAATLSLVLGRHEVRELAFDNGELWVYFGS